MKNISASIWISLRIWFMTVIFTGLFAMLLIILIIDPALLGVGFIIMIGAGIASIPTLPVLYISLNRIERIAMSAQDKMIMLFKVELVCCLIYGVPTGFAVNIVTRFDNSFYGFLICCAGAILVLSVSTGLSMLLSRKQLSSFFLSPIIHSSIIQPNKMETTLHPLPEYETQPASSSSNRILFKGLITGLLILFMLIPTVFINKLVYERKERQHEIVTEVSSKWSAAQTLTGPYLFVPYKYIVKDKDGKTEEYVRHFWIIPDQLNVSGNIDPQIRTRSIYKVLLYKADLNDTGSFMLQVPPDVDTNSIKWNEAKICFGLSDFKGIEERMAIIFNGKEYEFSPGLPNDDIDKKGLSVPVNLSIADFGKRIPFDMTLKLKGSEQLHFVPLSGNSEFKLKSSWPDPSFDGNNLPVDRTVSDSGFTAKWTFNKANLPFGTVLKDFNTNELNMDFGVTMLQPADQYAKTERSVKYAILFIGLTFALFFIVEIMQKKPVHPVQYVLIGLALVIFYSLLLSLSEFILFDPAYLISAVAIVSMITLYARSHFGNWKSAGLFGGVLTMLYAFIFILIRLEDTALLVGSIGLFIVLALVMYASRKVDWYGTSGKPVEVAV